VLRRRGKDVLDAKLSFRPFLRRLRPRLLLRPSCNYCCLPRPRPRKLPIHQLKRFSLDEEEYQQELGGGIADDGELAVAVAVAVVERAVAGRSAVDERRGRN